MARSKFSPGDRVKLQGGERGVVRQVVGKEEYVVLANGRRLVCHGRNLTAAVVTQPVAPTAVLGTRVLTTAALEAEVDPAAIKSLLEQENGLWWECPGCQINHAVPLTGPRAWTASGSTTCLTLSPSVRVRWSSPEGERVCHFHVVAGIAKFLNDCTHSNAGKEMPIAKVDYYGPGESKPTIQALGTDTLIVEDPAD